MPLPSFPVPLICEMQKMTPLCQLPQGAREDPAPENNQTMTSLTAEEAVFAHAHPTQRESGLGEGTGIYSGKKGCCNREAVLTAGTDRDCGCRGRQGRRLILGTLPNPSRWRPCVPFQRSHQSGREARGLAGSQEQELQPRPVCFWGHRPM